MQTSDARKRLAEITAEHEALLRIFAEVGSPTDDSNAIRDAIYSIFDELGWTASA